MCDHTFRANAVEAVERAVDNFDMTVDTCSSQPVGIYAVFVVEEITVADSDPCGRKAGEVLVSGGCGEPADGG